MTEPQDDRHLQALWQLQPRDGSTIALDLVRQMAEELEFRVTRRNRREYIAAAIAAAVFGWQMFALPSLLLRIGAGLCIVGGIAVVYMLRRSGTASTLPSDLGLTSALEFHRAQLERQRDLHRNALWWYLLPATPGVLVLEIGHILAQPERRSQLIVLSVVMFLFGVGVYVLNRRKAARIQRQIDRLEENL